MPKAATKGKAGKVEKRRTKKGKRLNDDFNELRQIG